ncbi:MAG: hypothetical protein WBD81_23430 [Collimonas pratensis]|uniref:hypothetical protein n=1 Tax=Collimonas pratensis TaxID=279113 RepID=UPI003C78ED7B
MLKVLRHRQISTVEYFFGAFISGRAVPRRGALLGLLTWSVMTVAGGWFGLHLRPRVA